MVELGGTHLSAALVSVPDAQLVGPPIRAAIDAHAPARHVLDTIARTAARLSPPRGAVVWAAAVPGPFDYLDGIARYQGVGKFDALNGVDVGAELARRVPASAGCWRFCNDADAFGAGCAVGGPLSGARRAVALTLGTGIGSAFLADGIPVHDGAGVPAGGEVHTLWIDGAPLEDRVSGRAVRAAYARAHDIDPADAPEVAAIAALARLGDPTAREVLREAFEALGAALAGPLADFGATDVAIGGSIVGSWDLVEPALARGFARGGLVIPRTVPVGNTETRTLIGAVDLAVRRDPTSDTDSQHPPG